MTFLAAVLPGVRDARTPFVVGALWAASLLLVGQRAPSPLANLEAVEDARQLLAMLPDGAAAAIGLFAVFALGVVMQETLSQLYKRQFAKKLWVAVTEKKPALRQFRTAAEGGFDTPKVRALVESTIRKRLTSYSKLLPSLIPRSFVFDEFDLASLKLSRKAPEQFQQYDRMRAEGDFRMAIALPVLVLAISFSVQLTLFLGVVAVLSGIGAAWALLSQGSRDRRRAAELLAGAVYFGYSSTPMLDTLVTSAERSSESLAKYSDGKTIDWFVDFLGDRDLLERYRPEVKDRVQEVAPGHVLTYRANPHTRQELPNSDADTQPATPPDTASR